MLYFALLLFALSAESADLVMIDFESELPNTSTSDAQAERVRVESGAVLRVATGHAAPWPGVTLSAPSGQWDLSPYHAVQVDLRNTGTKQVTVHCRVDNPGADGQAHCVTGSLELGPGSSGTLSVALKRTTDGRLDGKLFGMRGYPVETGRSGTIDAARITQILLFVAKPQDDHQFEADNVRAVGTYTPPTAWIGDADPFFPCIDTFGQYKHKTWPGKVQSLADLRDRREREMNQLADQPGPGNWNKWGGWADGPQLSATGYFRTEKYQGKWWLVDPDGRLFWSHGIDCVRMIDATPIEERESWFEGFPGQQAEFASFVNPGAYALKGHYADRSPRCFSFAAANLLRKYGADWQTAYPPVVHRRLRGWGLNTIANWSDEKVRLMRQTAYTDTISSGGGRMIEGSEGYWGKFPDVFADEFARRVQRNMEHRRDRTANDPWCIGYFSDNEMSWGDEMSLGLAALKSPPDQPAKQAFAAQLKSKYGGIEQLNAAWKTSHASWEDLAQHRDAPDRSHAAADLQAFYSLAAEQYFRQVRAAVKSVAPHQLYLGCRFAWVNALAAAAAAKHCDVVSYNLYRRSVADFQFNGGADVPLIIGEFHFGALDRGMFHTGLVPVANQAERAQAYADYVRGALRHPQFVGTHWFQYQDEPTTGRVYDEENYQIGFVDIADTPYPETIAASREVGAQLYQYRVGK